MPDGQIAGALAVPMKPTLPPRPAVSDISPRAKAPVAPEQIEFPEDIITGQPITQELSEAWMDLQNFVGSSWATYGINVQKPDPSSPAQGELYRRYIGKLNKVQMLGATAQREAKAETAFNLSVSRGDILAPSLKFKSFGERQTYAFPVNVFKDAVSQYNQDMQEFYRPEDKERADAKVGEQKQALRNQGEILKQQFLTGGYSEEENKEYSKYIDANVGGYISQVEDNYVDWKSRAQVGLARERAKKEFPAFDELHRTLFKEFELTEDYKVEVEDIGKEYKWAEAYRMKIPKFRGQPVKRTGDLIGTTLSKEEKGYVKYDTKKVYEVITPRVTGQVLSEDGDEIAFLFDDNSVKVMTLKELEKSYIAHSGIYRGTEEQSRLRKGLATFYKGKAPEKEKVPTKAKVPSASREEWRANKMSDSEIDAAKAANIIEVTGE